MVSKRNLYTRKKECIKVWIVFIPLLLLFGKISAQIYGLGFSSYEVNKDLRTTLDLSSDKPFGFKDDFELKFDLFFHPYKSDYFGYIFRIILDDKQSFDFISNVEKSKKQFNFISGAKSTSVNIDLSKEELFNTWNTFRFKFDFKQDKIFLHIKEKIYTLENAGLKKKATVRLIFGSIDSGIFETTDVPPMCLKDIQISEKNRLTYYWPLDEMKGTFAVDRIHSKIAKVKGPQWLASSYFNWNNTSSFLLKGLVNSAFDPSSETLYFVGADSLMVFSFSNSQLLGIKRGIAKKGRTVSRVQTFYDSATKKIYGYCVDSSFVTSFDFKQNNWQKPVTDTSLVTDFGHHNRIVSNYDTSLYIFGGYGHHKFKNLVQKVNFRTGEWKTIETKGDFFRPRYLAGSGKNETCDTFYILGGYGSETGDQMISPGNCYEMMMYSVPNRTFKKLFEFQPDIKGFSFAESLVIDWNNKHFYGLTFPQNKFNSKLQLIEGSLNNPGYRFVGDTIPYKFNSALSYANLYYSPKNRMLYAITIFYNENHFSEVKIYSIKFPPNPSEAGKPVNSKKAYFFGVALLVIVLLAGMTFIFVRQLRLRRLKGSTVSSIPGKKELKNIQDDAEIKEQTRPIHNAVFLFGYFQVINKEGENITRKFSPLLRELFLLIFFYSKKSIKGVSVEKIEELLWPGKDKKNAKNSRAVTMLRLKELIMELDGCHLTNKEGYLKMEVDKKILHIDYEYVNELIKKDPSGENTIFEIVNIVEKGSLLADHTYEWFEEFKSIFEGDIIDYLIVYANSLTLSKDANLVNRIADCIFLFDIISDEALIFKCQSLVALGKYNLAKIIYSKFVSDYKLMYNEEYSRSFIEIAGKQK